MPKDFNLDDGVEEKFTFTVLGNTYDFKYPNTEELEEFGKFAKEDSKKLFETLLKFITPVGNSESFDIVQKKMLSPHVIKFNRMIMEEIAGVKE